MNLSTELSVTSLYSSWRHPFTNTSESWRMEPRKNFTLGLGVKWVQSLALHKVLYGGQNMAKEFPFFNIPTGKNLCVAFNDSLILTSFSFVVYAFSRQESVYEKIMFLGSFLLMLSTDSSQGRNLTETFPPDVRRRRRRQTKTDCF